MSKISQDFLNLIAEEHGVSKAELNALDLALSGQTSEEISGYLNISAAAVRKRLGSVYQKFNITGNTPGKIEVLRTELIRRYQSSQKTNVQQHQDWGEAVKVSNFYGRQQELDQLEKWIIEEDCQLVTILGMGGIGKTALSVKLSKDIKERFDYVVWRSLRDAPPLIEVLANLLQFFLEQLKFPEWLKAELFKKDVHDRTVFLVNECFRKHRCLIVLDNLESILQSETRAGEYKDEDYGKFLRLVGEMPHKSCVMLTSREKPKEVALLEGKKRSVKVLSLGGLKEDGIKIFEDEGLLCLGTRKKELENKCEELIEHYGGNPLALRIAATTIQELFGGSIERFLEQKIEAFGDIRELLEDQFKRLSDLETRIMYWLAIERESVSISQLRENFVIPPMASKLLEAVESLKRRSLIEVEKNRASFSLHNVIVEYLYERLIEEICEEIENEKSDILNSYALLKATAKDYIREAQIRLILEPIKERLLAQEPNHVKKRFQKILSLRRKKSKEFSLQPGYAAGNILNLLCQLTPKLEGCDFSYLDIRQAYLQNVILHGVNFAHSKFSQTVFKKIFGGVLSIAFHPDDETLATGDTNGQISIWDIKSGELKQRLPSDNLMRSLTFSPDGKMLAHTGENQIITIWKQDENGKWNFFKALNDEDNQVWSVAYSPDSKTIVSGGEDGKLKIWSVDSSKCISTLTGHKECIRSVAYHPNGKIIASGSEDNTAKVWELVDNEYECRQSLAGHTNWVRAVAFSSEDGKYLATASEDNTVRLWKFVDNKYECWKILAEHTNWVWSVAFNPDGKYLASGSADGTIRVWDVATGKYLKTLEGHSNWVQSVTFNPKDNGRTLASGSTDRTVRIWDVNREECTQTIAGHNTWMRTIAFNPNDKNTIISGGEDRTVKVWNVDREEDEELYEHTSWIHSVVYSSKGQYIASSSPDRTIKIGKIDRDNKYQKITKILLEQNQKDSIGNWARILIFSPDSESLISGNEDNTIKIWDINSGSCLDTLEGHENWVSSLVFSPDGKFLVSGSTDKTIRIWQKNNNGKYKCLDDNILEGHNNWVNSVAFSPDNETIVSGSEDKTIKIWQKNNNGKYEYKQTLKNHRETVRSVAFNSDPESPILASGSKDKTIKIWKFNNGKWKCVNTLEEHESCISSVVFCSDNKTIASTSMDETIKLWYVDNNKSIKTLRSKPPYDEMNITEVAGLSDAQKDTLRTLGAVEDCENENKDNLDKSLILINNTIKNSQQKELGDLEKLVLLGLLKNQTYKEIARDSGYSSEYIARTVSHGLWQKLSKALGETIDKKSMNEAMRRLINEEK